jgi:SAM-dependent MidA family methyltransferase
MDKQMLLRRKIADRIRREGRSGWLYEDGGGKMAVAGISFCDYMAMCLYDEQAGYYRSGSVRIGREGDFYTSSGIGTIMSEMVAAYVARQASERGLPASIMEWGAGTGRQAVQMMQAWRTRHPSFAESLAYSIVDGDPVHLKEAQAAVTEAGLLGRVGFLSPEQAENQLKAGGQRIVIANELLDAFPVHRVIRLEGKLWELGVTLTGNGHEHSSGDGEGEHFHYCFLQIEHKELEASLAADDVKLKERQETEINLQAEQWLAGLGRSLDSGMVVVIDYGDTAAELTAPHRMKGTLLCYHKHTAHDNPFLHIGDQDITSHVNFSALRRAAESAGWQTVYFGSQKRFLVDNGILEELQNHSDPDPFGPAARRNRAVRQLLLSDGMSESFKVIVFAK